MGRLAKGENTVLPGVSRLTFTVVATGRAAPRPDLSAIALREGRAVADEADLVFYSQGSALGGAVACAVEDETAVRLDVDLAAMPAEVDRLVLAASLHDGDFAALGHSELHVVDGAGGHIATHPLAGDGRESALVLAEVYRRNGQWRLKAVSQGYADGFAGLLADFGIATTSAQATSVETPPISMRKEVIERELRKAEINGVAANVVFVVDLSGSMWSLFADGEITRLLEQLIPIADRFDDDGVLDVWVYGDDVAQLPSIRVSDYQAWASAWMPHLATGSIPAVGSGAAPAPLRIVLCQEDGKPIDLDSPDHRPRTPSFGRNNEPAVIRSVVSHYGNLANRGPTLVFFVTDGGVGWPVKVQALLRKFSRSAVYWNFLVIGGGRNNFYENHRGGIVQNTGAISVARLGQLSDEQLYGDSFAGFSAWLTAARGAGVVGL